MTRLDAAGRQTITNHVQLTCDTMTPKYYAGHLYSGYVPIMWPYRHVFRAAHATQRNATQRPAHAARSVPRRAAPRRHTFAHCAIRRRPYRRFPPSPPSLPPSHSLPFPPACMYAGHIDTQFDTHRLHNRPISRKSGSGTGAAERAVPASRSDLTDYDPGAPLCRHDHCCTFDRGIRIFDAPARLET